MELKPTVVVPYATEHAQILICFECGIGIVVDPVDLAESAKKCPYCKSTLKLENFRKGSTEK